ncbi:uncharacterized protein LOC128667679 [Microplitis demolitor]|uniref:uncharacterized protein LOC128667679 n=1 Tax=Microplitis demolitor TaxID=69319 RepID=UPI00235B6D95|nr:uncharacterized protein LOC128667679 [Microplitis demolitor]
MFTRYLESFAVASGTGAKVVDCLRTACTHWGTPQAIVCDNGTEFLNKDVKSFTSEKKITLITTPICHPQANPVERINRNLKTLLAAFVGSDQRDWDANLRELQFAYNTSIHSSLGVSPAYLNHGRELLADGTRRLETGPETVSEQIERAGKLMELRHLEENHMVRATDSQAKHYNRNRETAWRQFEVGDLVYFPNRQLSRKVDSYSSKLAPR